MKTETVPLPDGETLAVKVMLPPLNEYAERVDCWADVREEVLGGELSSWLYTPYFIGEIQGEVAGSMSYFTSAQASDVGVVEFVTTNEKYRRRGVGSALLDRLVTHFRARGGHALYLCTVNPVAGVLYEKFGFRYYVGDGMRYVAGDAAQFDATYLAHCGPARLRDATWADLPRASLLFNNPAPGWFIKDYLTRSFRDTRFESHFVHWMKGIAHNKGAVIALENPAGRLVGAAALMRENSYCEQHVAALSFRVCPAYMNQGPELLEAAVARAEGLGIGIVQMHLAECDSDLQELARAAGFREEARLRRRLRDGDGWLDLLVYGRLVSSEPPALFGEEEYYGNRKAWQSERSSKLSYRD